MFFLCKRCLRQRKLKSEDIIPAIVNGDLEKLKNLLAIFFFDLNHGMLEAVKAGQLFTTEFFLLKGATNKDECLKIASEKNQFDIARILLENGASPITAIRYAKSPNIIKMAYRFEQKNGMIT